jgi:hypothetical protein
MHLCVHAWVHPPCTVSLHLDDCGCCPAQDDDPYVRKTAAICVLKLFDINPELVDDRGFLDMLRVGGQSLLALPCSRCRFRYLGAWTE